MYDVQEFDVEPFGLSFSEAVMVDPQQRLLLEATASLLPSAAGTSALDAAVGVFVGISNPDYANIKTAATPISVYSATGEYKLSCLLSISLLCWWPAATALGGLQQQRSLDIASKLMVNKSEPNFLIGCSARVVLLVQGYGWPARIRLKTVAVGVELCPG